MISAKEKNKSGKGEIVTILDKVARDGFAGEREWTR